MKIADIIGKEHKTLYFNRLGYLYKMDQDAVHFYRHGRWICCQGTVGTWAKEAEDNDYPIIPESEAVLIM